VYQHQVFVQPLGKEDSEVCERGGFKEVLVKGMLQGCPKGAPHAPTAQRAQGRGATTRPHRPAYPGEGCHHTPLPPSVPRGGVPPHAHATQCAYPTHTTEPPMSIILTSS